jgi:hypothetical protein
MSNSQADRQRDTDRFYALLDELSERIGGPRHLKDYTEAGDWPLYGVEFFLEDGQFRAGGSGLRGVRVGSHALRTTSQTSFWTRLSQHRGPVNGANAGVGNHRGSIFRHHVGTALLQRDDWPIEVEQSWRQQKVSPLQRKAERLLEQAVSAHIGAMPLLWLDVPDREHRKSIRANAVALLSQRTGGIHPTAPGWLGLHAGNDNVRSSGLWNSNFVDDLYDPSFLDAMEACVKAM